MFLADKVAVVTGASRGIGRAVAVELARRGAVIALNYSGNNQAADETVSMISSAGSKVLLIQANVAESSAVNDMVKKTIAEFGRIDILINNAGITRDNLLIRMKDEEWDAVIATNLRGVFNCTRAVAKIMIKQRSGRIVNISSVVGQIGNAGQANYAAAKAGVLGFTKATARELASRGITVNAIAPGYIETDMTGVLSDEAKIDFAKKIPLGRLGQADDIAKAVAFLVSEHASYITGQVLNVDGGMVMQ